ncbi:MAG: ROK family protein [Cyclobacteriaceae bacterium]|jgi:polyphosphate glucokinase|nr:ROK family protein [Cyclobacteriaceae bacterium]
MNTTVKTLPSTNILSIDIGGSNIKGVVMNPDGEVVQAFQKVKTPDKATPENVLEAIKKLVINFENYYRVSVGFPGYVKKGIVYTAPNLDTESWKGVNLNYLISDALDKPVRTANDADLHGIGVVRGKGLEMVITLGTGFGTALLLDGNLLPHLELAHHPITKKNTYDTYIGDSALKRIGPVKWNKRVQKILKALKVVFNFDHLYIGGGNASKINFRLDKTITIISNKDGIRGGARLWQLDENLFMRAREKFLQ